MPEETDREFLVIICESGEGGQVIRRIQQVGVTRYTVHRGRGQQPRDGGDPRVAITGKWTQSTPRSALLSMLGSLPR